MAGGRPARRITAHREWRDKYPQTMQECSAGQPATLTEALAAKKERLERQLAIFQTALDALLEQPSLADALDKITRAIEA